LRLTLVALGATIFFELVKDLDFEAAALFSWILFGLWMFRHHFDADSEASRMRWGLAVLVVAVLASVLYAFAGALLLSGQLERESGWLTTLESLVAGLTGSSTSYRALTERSRWFLDSLPVVSYVLLIFALTQLLRPVIAPRVVAADREKLEALLRVWGCNYISHLAVHGASSYHWLDGEACIAFTLRGRTALALGDPIGPPQAMTRAVQDFVSYCDKQDCIKWTIPTLTAMRE
jgi:phosphatidylglycerol lysyltransferase